MNILNSSSVKSSLWILMTSTLLFQQAMADAFSDKSALVAKDAKGMEKVFESVVAIEKGSKEATEEFYLPKGDYVLYVLVDESTLKKADFSVAWDSMEGDIDDHDKRTITGSMWSNEPRFVVTNPISVSTGFSKLEFEIDNLMAAINTANEKNAAQYAANTSGMSQTYTKYANGAASKVTITIDPTDLTSSKGLVRLMVFED
jgi:hypothetical protein